MIPLTISNMYIFFFLYKNYVQNRNCKVMATMIVISFILQQNDTANNFSSRYSAKNARMCHLFTFFVVFFLHCSWGK